MILLTRQIDLAKATDKRLKDKGYKSSILPLLKIEHISTRLPDDCDYIIVTSQNSIYPLSTSNLNKKKIKLIVVGKHTAEKLAELNYKIEHTYKDNEELLANIEKIVSKDKKLLYVSGRDIASKLDKKLKVLGYRLKRTICYKALARRSMPKDYLDGIKCITFYSARTAKIFKRLNKESLRNVMALCMSKNIKNEIESLGFRKIEVADYPSEESMIEKLQSFLPANKK